MKKGRVGCEDSMEPWFSGYAGSFSSRLKPIHQRVGSELTVVTPCWTICGGIDRSPISVHQRSSAVQTLHLLCLASGVLKSAVFLLQLITHGLAVVSEEEVFAG